MHGLNIVINFWELSHISSDTGVDLSKILGGQTKILEGQKEVKSDKCVGVSQLMGALSLAAPKSSPMSLDAKFKHICYF